MSWITLLWSMDAAFCFTAAGIYLLIWSRRRQNLVYLLFSSSALATGIIAELELICMHAQTTAQYSAVLRWAQLPIWMLTLSIVWFGRLYLRAGRLWLAWCVCCVRTLALLLNFLSPPNLNFREVTSLGHLSWWGGETVSVAVGVPNPWSLIGQLSTLLVLIFFVDATIAVWRRGEQRRALLVGGSAILFITLALAQSVLVIWGAVRWPFINSIPYLGIIAAMGYELSYDFLRAAKLAQDFQTSEAALRESEARINIATNAANLGLWLWNIPSDQLRVTQKWRELFGFPDSEPVTFDRLLQLVHPEDRERMKQLVQQMFEHGGEYESEYRITRPDGSTRWILGYGSVELDERGKPAFARGVSRDITTRKLAEEELRESEERFRTVANAAPVMIWMTGPDKLCTFVNKGWLDFTGRSLEQELANGWAEGLHLEDLDRSLDVYQNSFNARESFTMEYRLRRSDGEYRWVLDSGTPRFAPDGAFLGYIGSCIDITERKSAEEQFRLVLDATPNAMIMVDSAGVINFANASAATVFGYPLNQLIGCQIETLIPEGFRDRHPGDRKHFVSEPNSRAMGVERDLFGRRKDGTEFPVEARLNPIHTAEGLFVLASLIDITERKRAELAVRQSEERLRLIIDTALEAVISMDTDGAVTHWNAEAEKIFGWTQAEATGKKLSELIIPLQHRAVHERGLRHYRDTGAGPMLGKRIEITALHRDGREFPVELAITPAVIGGRVYFTAFISDITARKEAELERERQNMELARAGRVALMGELAASLAHEVNNPVGAIVANASAGQRLLAAGKIGTEEMTELLADIVADGRRAGEIIRGIRNMVRKGEAQHSLVQINDIIDDLLRIVHGEAIGREVRVTVEVDSNAGQVWGDSVQLLQVLLNLTVNAFEAMTALPANARSLIIRAGHDGKGDILVRVHDSGPGFPSGISEQLFEPFFSTKAEGTGMGLAIARSIVEAHGGALSAENCDDGGACFTIRLPEAKEDKSKSPP
jgi:PAS domain S-box-containing protein